MASERKQCARCGAHTLSSVCTVCRSMHLELVEDLQPWGPRFSRRKISPYVTELSGRARVSV